MKISAVLYVQHNVSRLIAAELWQVNNHAQRRLHCLSFFITQRFVKQSNCFQFIHDGLLKAPNQESFIFLYFQTLYAQTSRYPLSFHNHSSAIVRKRPFGALRWLKRLVGCLSQQWTQFHPRAVSMRFVVN
jgi:hypothetical protein